MISWNGKIEEAKNIKELLNDNFKEVEFKDLSIDLDDIEKIENYTFYNCSFYSSKANSEVRFYGCTFVGCTFEDCYHLFFWYCKFQKLTFFRESCFLKFNYCHFNGVEFVKCFSLDFDTVKFFAKIVWKSSNSTFTFWNSYFDDECVIFGKNNLSNVFIDGCKNTPNFSGACPSEGEFIGWKYVRVRNEEFADYYLVKLLIPDEAKRSNSGRSRKCRCEFAEVLDIEKLDVNNNFATLEHVNSVLNIIGTTTTEYKVGDMVYPDSYDDNWCHECSNGIHFFVTRDDAISYARDSLGY